MKKFLNIVYYIIIAILFIHLTIYIFGLSKIHMNSDSAFVVDYAVEIINTNEWFPNGWGHANDFWIYSLIPLVTVFINLGINFFLSRQLAVFIQTILFFILLYDLLTNTFNIDGKKGHFKSVFLLILSGFSGQFLFEMFGDATYGSIAFYMLLEIWLYFEWKKCEVKKKRILLMSLLCITILLLCSCSLRFAINVTAPLVMCLLNSIYLRFEGFNKKSWDNVRRNAIFMMLLLIATGAGLIINKVLEHTFTITYNMVHNPIDSFADISNGIFETIDSYLLVNGSLHTCIYSLSFSFFNDFISNNSPTVLFTFIKLVFAIFILIVPIILFKKKSKLHDSEKDLLIYVVTYISLTAFFMIFMGMSVWYRYVTPLLFFMMLLLPVFYRNICVDIKKKFIYWLFIIVVSISSTVLCINSYFDLHEMKMRVNPNETITNYLKEKGYKNGFRTTNAEHNIFYMFSDGKVRMINLSDKKGKYNMYHWLESKNWINELPKNEKVFYLEETDYNSLCFVIESMAMEYDEYDGYSIYVFENYDSMMFALRENYKYNKRMGLIPEQEN